MKTKYLFLILMLLSAIGFAQRDYPRLNVIFKKNFDTKKDVYVEPIIADNVFAIDLLKNSLTVAGFNAVANPKKAEYIIKLIYKARNDQGCNGSVMKSMKGSVVDSKNEIVVEFNFGQSALEMKCTKDVMNRLVDKLHNQFSIGN